jgi:hypothetical protein
VVEKADYDTTIFKVHCGKMTLKIYSKGERVLRIEVILHNAKAYRWGHSLPCFPEIVVRLKGVLERFLNAAGCINACFVSDETLENLPQPAQIGQTKVGGIDLNKPRIRRMTEAVLALSVAPTGFTSSDLALQVRSSTGWPESKYGVRRAAYDIVMREKIIRPLLTASGQPEPALRPANPTPIDHHYEALRSGMRNLFIDLGIAA